MISMVLNVRRRWGAEKKRQILVHLISQILWLKSFFKTREIEKTKDFECKKQAAAEKEDATVAVIPVKESKEEAKAYIMVELVVDKTGEI